MSKTGVGNTEGILINEPTANTSGNNHNPPIPKSSFWQDAKVYVHTGLDVLSIAPVIGAVADGLNGVIYSVEGDTQNATLSFTSAALDLVPGAGTGAKIVKGVTGVVKVITKAASKSGLKHAEKGALKLSKRVMKTTAKKNKKPSAKGKITEDGIAIKDKKNRTNNKNCPQAGHPVNPILGIKILTDEMDLDFVLPAALSLLWQRSYYSDQVEAGWLGQGWSLPFSKHLLRKSDGMVFVDEQGRKIQLPTLEAGHEKFDRHNQLFFSREVNGRYCITMPDRQLRYLFSPLDAGEDDPQGDRAMYLPLIAIQDTDNNLIRLFYNGAGLPLFIQDAASRWLKLDFITIQQSDGHQIYRLQKVNLLNKKTQKQNNVPHVETLVMYRYSTTGDLISVEDGQGQIKRGFAYNNHILIEHSQPGGLIARYQYDAYTPEGKVIRHTTNLGQVWLFDYRENETWVTDPLQRITRYQYDANKALTGLVDGCGQVTRAILDHLGRPVTIIMPEGRQTHRTYDQYGKITSDIDAAGNRTLFSYDIHQRLTGITDATGHITRYDYNQKGDVLNIVTSSGQHTEYHFEQQGLLTAIKSDSGEPQRMQYNTFGMLTSYTDCSGHTTRFDHDINGRSITVTAPDGTQTMFLYNTQRQPLMSLFPDGCGEYFTYDSLNRLTGLRNQLGAQTHWQLDFDGLPLKRVNACGGNFNYEYDKARRLVKLMNENGALYRIGYDKNDNILWEQTFDNRVTHYKYNDSQLLIDKKELGSWGNVQAENITGTGIRTTFLYDKSDRIIEKISWNETKNTATHSYFDYNSAGLLILAKNDHCTIRRNYNKLGLLTSETCEIMGQSYTLQHEYDRNGLRSRTLFPDETQVDFLYYGPGHLLQINVDGKVACEIERDNMHREICRTQGALTSYFRYSPTGQIINQKVFPKNSNTPPVILRRYQYDKGGNLQLMYDQFFGEICYQYDPMNRLISTTNEIFCFDPAHNLTDSTSSVNSHKVINNRLTRYQHHHYTYDNYGNLHEKITDGEKHLQLAYDSEHQLVRLTPVKSGHCNSTEYGYDALGRRVYKKNGNETVIFLWDGDHMVGEIRSGYTRLYLYEPDSFVPLMQLVQYAQQTSKKVYYYHTDQTGTPRELTSSENGEIVWRACYKAWGKIQTEIPTKPQDNREIIFQPLRFQGQYYDAESGLHYNRHRYYDPDIGRFITPDPIGLAGGENPYQYAPSTTVWTDPLGLMPQPIPGGNSGTIGHATYQIDPRTKNMTIKMHGGPFTSLTDRVVSGQKLGRQAQEIIEQRQRENHVNRITLLSCYSGWGGSASQAQQVANLTGRTTTGYVGKYREINGRPFMGNGGTVKNFQPSTSAISNRISSALNQASSAVVTGAKVITQPFRKH